MAQRGAKGPDTDVRLVFLKSGYITVAYILTRNDVDS